MIHRKFDAVSSLFASLFVVSLCLGLALSARTVSAASQVVAAAPACFPTTVNCNPGNSSTTGAPPSVACTAAIGNNPCCCYEYIDPLGGAFYVCDPCNAGPCC